MDYLEKLKKDLLDELSYQAQRLNEYQMLKWLEENKVRLNEHGIWLPEEKDELIKIID